MDIDPEKRTALLEQAALGGEETIGGLTLRPLTYGSHSLYMRLKLACEESGPVDSSFTLASFIYLHSQPVPALAALYARPEQLAAAIVVFMADKPFDYFQQFEEWMNRQVGQYAASRLQASGNLDPDPKV